MDLGKSIDLLQSSIVGQFNARTVAEGRKRRMDFGVSMECERRNGSMWFTFSKGNESHSFNIPIPFVRGSVLMVEVNEVQRALCNYLLMEDSMILDYTAIMSRIVCGKPNGIVPKVLIKKIPFIQQIVYSFDNGNTSTIMYNLQRAINEVVNRMPLHETALNSWVMNRRLMIIDPLFDELRSPEDRLNYQIEKSIHFFPYGWTQVGLADGALSDKNYTLMYDIRRLTPFGLRHHNPQRNLYSSLGMKGQHLPNIRSKSMQDLIEGGVERRGWNWFTLFMDTPDVFEDQIVVNECHRNKYISYKKRLLCYGMVKVKAGERITKWQTVSISDAGVAKKFDIDCDWAVVRKVAETTVNVGGVATHAFNVVIEYRRKLRDGVKITNMHGNKGVIRLRKLGYAVDPRTGDTRRLDVIVSAKSVEKRKNYGQLLEALLNNVTPEEMKPVVLPDEYQTSLQQVKEALKVNGLPEDGTWHCETYRGPAEGVCGEVFWGVIASVENALWERGATLRTNTRGLRVAGLKFSHVEFRSMETAFGKDNPVLKEILSYAQGGEDIRELVKVLESKQGTLPERTNIYASNTLHFVNQSSGTIVSEDCIKGTVADENFEPDGFIIQLPVTLETIVDKNDDIIYEGLALLPDATIPADAVKRYITNVIYVPSASLRRCWQHDSGKFGLSEIGVLVNNILIMVNRYLQDTDSQIHLRMLVRSVSSYFYRIADMMSTKRGDVSRLGMAVRYPFSVKAVATLTNRLPANTIEIHTSMADTLRVNNNDVVIVERFPCLGFMSIRPQRVRITNDEMCRYTIRVSGNCLGSMGLDFDGDNLFIASFHTPESKALLLKEWQDPDPACEKVICSLNEKAGRPCTANLSIDDYNIQPFDDLTADEHAQIVSNLTGVKSHTGPVIALAYNLMRVLENSDVQDDHSVNVAIQVFLDRVGNTVFKQKHGVKPLHAITTDAICTGDIETLVKHGFEREPSTIICNIVAAKARTLGVSNLAEYHKAAKEKGWSNIINRIVRVQNKIYFASRASLNPCQLLAHLSAPAVDIPSLIFKDIVAGRIGECRATLIDILGKDLVSDMRSAASRDACETLMDLVDNILSPKIGSIEQEAAA